MNIITLLDELNLENSMVMNPVHFLLFQETFIENYAPMYFGGYGKIYNKDTLNKYFTGKTSFEETFKDVEYKDFELPHKDILLPLIKWRIEEIKDLDEPQMTKDKKIILNAVLNSVNEFISLPYIGKSLHKLELITLLSLTEWGYGFSASLGNESDAYIALEISIVTIFDLRFEVYLPHAEIKNLIELLSPTYYSDDIFKHQSLILNEHQNRISALKKTLRL